MRSLHNSMIIPRKSSVKLVNTLCSRLRKFNRVRRKILEMLRIIYVSRWLTRIVASADVCRS